MRRHFEEWQMILTLVKGFIDFRDAFVFSSLEKIFPEKVNGGDAYRRRYDIKQGMRTLYMFLKIMFAVFGKVLQRIGQQTA